MNYSIENQYLKLTVTTKGAQICSIIRKLMEYVRKHNFSAFGVYRIVLGALVLLYFAVKSVVGVG